MPRKGTQGLEAHLCRPYQGSRRPNMQASSQPTCQRTALAFAAEVDVNILLPAVQVAFYRNFLFLHSPKSVPTLYRVPATRCSPLVLSIAPKPICCACALRKPTLSILAWRINKMLAQWLQATLLFLELPCNLAADHALEPIPWGPWSWSLGVLEW